MIRSVSPFGPVTPTQHMHQVTGTVSKDRPVSILVTRIGWHRVNGQTQSFRAAPGPLHIDAMPSP